MSAGTSLESVMVSCFRVSTKWCRQSFTLTTSLSSIVALMNVRGSLMVDRKQYEWLSPWLRS